MLLLSTSTSIFGLQGGSPQVYFFLECWYEG